jgi:hypothetical protein
MELTFEQIMSAMAGAVTYEVEEGTLYPRRLTEEQAAVYQDYPFFLRNSKATAGMRFSFETNSRVFDCTFRFKEASSRSYYSFDVFVNDRCVGFIDNFSDKELPIVYCPADLAHDEKCI